MTTRQERRQLLDEQVFTVNQSTPTPAERITLEEAGLLERRHLQEWVIANPEILGAGTMVVTSEFSGWGTSNGARDADRLDVLGLLQDGRLVVAELKRGPAPHTIEMQAMNYAARASAFSVDQLAAVHRKFLETHMHQTITLDEARQRLEANATELSEDTLADVPRIVLLATEFGLNVTTTAVFFSRKLGVDLHLIRVQAYRTASQDVLVTTSRIYPPPEIDEFVLQPNIERDQERRLEKKREANTVTRLIAANAIPDGTELRLRPGSEMASALRDQVAAWVAQDAACGRAAWQNNPSAPLIWAVDGQAWSPTGLVLHIIEEATGERSRSIAGPRSWQDVSGRNLPDIADQAANS
jgi:hypothetical protein